MCAIVMVPWYPRQGKSTLLRTAENLLSFIQNIIKWAEGHHRLTKSRFQHILANSTIYSFLWKCFRIFKSYFRGDSWLFYVLLERWSQNLPILPLSMFVGCEYLMQTKEFQIKLVAAACWDRMVVICLKIDKAPIGKKDEDI